MKKIKRARLRAERLQAKLNKTHEEESKNIFLEIPDKFWDDYYALQNKHDGTSKEACTCDGCVIFDYMFGFVTAQI